MLGAFRGVATLVIPMHLESGCLLAPLHLKDEKGVIRKSIYRRGE